MTQAVIDIITKLKSEIKQPHYVGHRSRVKDKFLTNSESFTEYELLELMLFYAVPRKDVKPLAKDFLKIYPNINSLLNADQQQLMEIDGVTQNIIIMLKLIREMFKRSLQSQIMNKNVISSWSALIDYLKFEMGYDKIESFRILFLDKKNQLIADELMSSGTIDQAPVFPREVVKKAIKHEAGALILVHNHPTGNVKPSNADIDLTAQIVTACKLINVTVHDHVIIGSNGHYSFKSNMLL